VSLPPRPALLLSALLAIALAAGSAAAGDGHGTDLFAGYSFADIDDSQRHGANLAVGFDLGPLSGFVDLSSHWGSESGVSLNDLTLMAGPGVRIGTRGGTVLFVRALAGLVRDKGTIGVLDVDISEASSRFGILAGGGVDLRVSTALAVRLQGDYLWNDVEVGGDASGFRVSAGIVYRFGSAR
jgi:opacity protein-like surface antigen